MIETIEPFSADGLGFAVLAAGSVLVAWSSFRGQFLIWMAVASTAFLATWLDLWAVFFLVLFVVPPYLATWWAWGDARGQTNLPLILVIVWQVLFFSVLNGYTGFEALQFWDHPVAIVGLSYILFRQLHLIVDAGNCGEYPLSPLRYGVYMLSFWTILAGPIQRYPNFCQGLEAIGRPQLEPALASLHRGINGMLKAFLIAPLFYYPHSLTLLEHPTATILDGAAVFYGYPVYLYLNFAGYTDLVIAIATLCGMQTMPENFNKPYLACNLQDFWNRWHMSFSHWIRDYIFLPLNVAVHRRLKRKWQSLGLVFAVVVTFVIVGMWHGTTVEFLVFGILHSLGVLSASLWGLALKRVLGKQRKKVFQNSWPWKIVAWALTFHFVCFTVLLIHDNLGDIWRIMIAGT